MSKIRQFIQSLTNPKSQIVYVIDECSVRCQEISRDTRYSYFYRYTKPSLFVTSDNRRIPEDEILKSLKNGKTLIKGLIGEFHDFHEGVGVRNREYILHISMEACPLKIKYSSGSGEGYSDSDYWSSERKEYWITYLCDAKTK